MGPYLSLPCGVVWSTNILKRMIDTRQWMQPQGFQQTPWLWARGSEKEGKWELCPFLRECVGNITNIILFTGYHGEEARVSVSLSDTETLALVKTRLWFQISVPSDSVTLQHPNLKWKIWLLLQSRKRLENPQPLANSQMPETPCSHNPGLRFPWQGGVPQPL